MYIHGGEGGEAGRGEWGRREDGKNQRDGVEEK
jgi:hypothetical protein